MVVVNKTNEMTIGLELLYSSQVQPGLTHYFEQQLNYEKHDLDLGNYRVTYFLNDNICVITTPMLTQNPKQSFAKEPLFEHLMPALLEDLTLQHKSLENTQIIVPLIGSGATERHITTLYIDNNANFTIFDSKLSNPEQFLSDSGAPGWHFLTIVAGILRSLFNWKYSNHVQCEQAHAPLNDVQYEGLGTQSFMDGITCGYHTMGTMKVISKLLANKQPVTRESVLQQLETHNPIQESLAMLASADHFVDNELSTFLTHAWQKSFHYSDKKESFDHFFLGVPHADESPLWGIITPFLFIKNCVKSLTEVPIALTASFFDYLRNRLYQTAPTHWYSKLARTVGLGLCHTLYGITEGVRLVLTLIFSPCALFREKYAKHDPATANGLVLNNEAGHDFCLVDDINNSHRHINASLPATNVIPETSIASTIGILAESRVITTENSAVSQSEITPAFRCA